MQCDLIRITSIGPTHHEPIELVAQLTVLMHDCLKFPLYAVASVSATMAKHVLRE
jgi:hypothetical protein